jgi:hypothetical protein
MRDAYDVYRGNGFDEYLKWLRTCVCVDCGAKQSERPRDEHGVAMDTWVTETQCLSCWQKNGDAEFRRERAKKTMITADNPVPSDEELEIATTRLRGFIESRLEGKCRIISEGHECKCALCDFDRMRAAIRGIKDRLYLAELDAAISGTETGQYWRGNDEAYASMIRIWGEALTSPIPKAGRHHDDLEALYRKTEALRIIAKKLADALYNVHAWAPTYQVEREESVQALAEYHQQIANQTIVVS